MIKLYNTPLRKKQEFKALKNKTVGYYSCGPTVYNYAHIGNLRTYIFADILKRVLKYNGYRVKHIMNITDVGHLTNDSDFGEDKMLLAALRENRSVWDVARYYTEVFQKNLKDLNIIEPSKWTKATDHIKEQINLIKTLEKRGFTYKTSDGIYFDTAKFKNYSKFAHLQLENQKAGARVEVGEEKRQPWDFALWKFSLENKKDSKRLMEWNSPWGVGFPGWHIECSAMAIKYLGQPFDIHSGGIDHVSIHHTNEVAQSEAAYDRPLANYWLHGGHLMVNDRRMGKSEGNFITLQTLMDRGYNPISFRFFCLNAHYRQTLNFTYEALDAATSGLANLKKEVLDIREMMTVSRVRDTENQTVFVNDLLTSAREQFLSAINDDLNVSKAVGVVFSLTKRIKREQLSKKSSKAIYNTLLDFDSVLGLGLDKVSDKKEEIPEHINKLIIQRNTARANKDWSESDRLRSQIEKEGYIVEDTKEGTKIVNR